MIYRLRPRSISADIDAARALVHLLDGPELDGVMGELDQMPDHRLRAEIVAAVLRRTQEMPAKREPMTPATALDRWAPGIDRASLFVIIAVSTPSLRNNSDAGSRCVNEVIETAFDVVRWWR